MKTDATILLVEDYPLSITIVKKILEDKNYAILTAETTNQVFNTLEKHEVDLILLDVILPDENGFDICRKLKNKPLTKNIPVIFLTALQDIDYIAEGFAAGGVDYIPKAYLETELIFRVENQLEITKSHKKLLHSNKTLTETIESRNQFYSIIAHDLKNPLTTLLMTTRWLNADFDSIPANEIKLYLSELDNSAKKMSNLLENLLQWAHFHSNNISYNPKIVNLFDEVQNALSLFKLDALTKKIILKNSLPSTIKVYADENILQVLLRNFIANAVKFTPENGKIQIKIEEATASVRIFISDTGTGIDEERLKEIKKGNTSYATPGTNLEKGSGIGLTVCRKLLKLANKNFGIESTIGKGTTVYFDIDKS